MAIQYQDGSFSKTMQFNEIMEQFTKEREEGIHIKALHFGTPQQIEAEKEKQAIEDRIAELEQKVEGLSPVKTTLEIPTVEDIWKFTGKTVLGRELEEL